MLFHCLVRKNLSTQDIDRLIDQMNDLEPAVAAEVSEGWESATGIAVSFIQMCEMSSSHLFRVLESSASASASASKSGSGSGSGQVAEEASVSQKSASGSRFLNSPEMTHHLMSVLR